MRIGIDIRMIFPFPTGIGNYRSSLIKALQEVDKENEYILIGTKGSKYQSDLYAGENFKIHYIGSPANSLSQHLFLYFQLKPLDLDLLWTDPWSATLFLPCKYVLTIYDLIYHRYPEYGSWKSKFYELFLERLIAKRAKSIVVTSDFVKHDIDHFLEVSPEKIFNTSGGAAVEYRIIKDQKYIDSVLKKYDLVDKKFFTYLGNQRPHKNLVGLLSIFERYKEQSGLDSKLVIIGGIDAKGRDQDSMKLQSKLESMNHSSDVIFLGKVFDNNEVCAIFMNSIALVHPSKHEGYGMTPLEAMNSGCPVITSNVTSLPEIVGDKNLTHAPEDEKAFADSMELLATDNKEWEKYSKLAYEQGRKFTWEKAAKKHIKVFQDE